MRRAKGGYMEGSVIVDGFDSDTEEESTVEGENQETESEGETPTSAPLQTGTDDPDDKSEPEEPKLTEKGTKLDPNPQSAVHQELANARRMAAEMQKVLNDPVLFAKYAEEAGFNKKYEPDAPVFTPDKLQTADDVIKALNEMNTKFTGSEAQYKKEIESLKGALGQLTEGRQIEKNVSTLKEDASVLREKYPELKPGTPSYSEKLEEKIGELYQKLDFDDRGLPQGKITLRQVGDMVMEAAYELKKKGSEEAQTDIKDKSLGKVIVSNKGKQEVKESDDPATTIAQRISKIYK